MKKKFTAVALFIVLLMGLAACASKGTKGYESNTGLVAIPGFNDLYYDSQTKVVYFVFNECSGYQGYGYMSTTHSIRNWLKLVMHRPSRPRISNQIFFQGERIADYKTTHWW